MNLGQIADAITPKMPGQAPAQIRTGPVVSQTGSTVTVEISDAPVEATATDGLVYAPGSEVMCLTTPDRVIVLGSADGSTVTRPGWQPVLNSSTGQPIVNDTRLQGITQGVFAFDGTWEALQVMFVGGADIASSLRIRINDDSTASAHRAWGWIQSATGGGSSTWNVEAGAWEVGPLHVGFANNSYTVDINRTPFSTAFKTFHSFGRGGGEMVQGGGNTLGLTDTSPVHSLRLLATSGAVFNNSTLVTIEGLRA